MTDLPEPRPDPPAASRPSAGSLEPTPLAPPPTPWQRLRRVLFGPARNPFDPKVFKHTSLVAVLAWIGLGSDGMSSACYGPEEAFLALGTHPGLALILAAMTAITVLVVSASYTQIIERFPSGGGAYVVASKFLGRHAGLVAGSALLIDYVLTIAISLASGAEALLSLFDPSHAGLRLTLACAGLLVLVLLNLRGVRESVMVIAPVFFLFIVTHLLVIVAPILGHGGEIFAVLGGGVGEVRTGATEMGTLGLALVLLRAYSLGGGTYTGIEAVSNSLPLLREPRVQTGKRAMLYMAVSLAVAAGGLLLAYLLVGVEKIPGRTLNATLFERAFADWPGGGAIVLLGMLSEAGLLFIASQTGLAGGPQVLSAMAGDGWVPRRFLHLSDRLVRENGVLLMGLAAAVTLLLTGAHVSLLVVLYSINVFLGFTLSQAGMVRHWFEHRRRTPVWGRKLAVNALGLLLTGFILVVTSVVKFGEGGWVTLFVTACLTLLCVFIRKHYALSQQLFRRLDAVLADLPAAPEAVTGKPDPAEPTAVVLVGGYSGLGIHTLLSVFRHFGTQFKGVVFLSVGILDSDKFKGPRQVDNLRRNVDASLLRYVEVARRLGVPADSVSAIGTDPVAEIEGLADVLRERYPRSVFFAGKLVFRRETLITRLLHNQTANAVQSRLHPKGYPVMILPILAE